MFDAEYWWDQAFRFRERAEESGEHEEELLDLAVICEEVANQMADRCPSG